MSDLQSTLFEDATYSAISEFATGPENRFMVNAKAGGNCFLTGQAGTGKSTLLRQFIAECPQRVDLTAPTGIAALNIGGTTTHRFCGMMLGPQGEQTNEDYFAWLQRQPYRSIKTGFFRVQRCECLVIDEISMLPGRQLDFINWLFKHLRGDKRPFGGCQIIATGDFLQLPPVRTSETQAYDWAFLSAAWKEAGLKTFKLETVRRQDEPVFVGALSSFRVGRVSGESMRTLAGRVVMFPPAPITRLFTHNVQVDKWNDFQLGELPGEPVSLEMVETGDGKQVEFLKKNLLTPATLLLKPGARVMFTVNRRAEDYEHVNGQTGTVELIDHEQKKVHVRADAGGIIPVDPYVWKYNHENDMSAQVVQYPLRLAYALTIHKSQGLTLDAAHVDIRAAREPGQAYVALSRVRTLQGLSLKEWPKGLFVSSEAVKFYEEN